MSASTRVSTGTHASTVTRTQRLALAICAALSLLLGCQTTVPTTPPEEIDAAVLSATSAPRPVTPFVDGDLIAPGVELPEPNLWADLIEGFQLDRHTEQKRVQQELRWLQRHPSYLHNMQGRLARHLAYIHAEVEGDIN